MGHGQRGAKLLLIYVYVCVCVYVYSPGKKSGISHQKGQISNIRKNDNSMKTKLICSGTILKTHYNDKHEPNNKMTVSWSWLSSSSHICLTLLLYLIFDGHCRVKNRLTAKYSDIGVLYVSNTTSRPQLDASLVSNNMNRRKIDSASSREVFMVTCCFVRKSVIAYLLIYLANDVELNPGPDASSLTLKSFTRSRGLKVAHINIRSIMGKLDLLKLLLMEKPIDILAVSETWLKPSILDSEVCIDEYSCVRRDRLGKGGGGTMIYVRDGISYRVGTELGSGSTESCSVEILRPKSKKVIIWSIYRAPNGNVDIFIDELNGVLQDISDQDEVLLLGDFNISNLANAHDLEQIIDQPTRVTETSTLIDLVFSNTVHRITDHGVIDLSLSDHSMVFCVVKAGVTKASGKTIEYRFYKRYQKNGFIQELCQTDWSIVDNESDVDSALLAWNELFLCTANRHAPIKTARIKGTKLP